MLLHIAFLRLPCDGPQPPASGVALSQPVCTIMLGWAVSRDACAVSHYGACVMSPCVRCDVATNGRLAMSGRHQSAAAGLLHPCGCAAAVLAARHREVAWSAVVRTRGFARGSDERLGYGDRYNSVLMP